MAIKTVSITNQKGGVGKTTTALKVKRVKIVAL